MPNRSLIELRKRRMARTKATQDFNSFSRGLITEASELNFPENASLSEINFNLNRDGSRQRRLGIDYEAPLAGLAQQTIDPGIGSDPEFRSAMSTYEWKGVGDQASRTFTVVHFLDYIMFFDLNRAGPSQFIDLFKVYEVITPSFDFREIISFTSEGGRLIAATGKEEVKVYSYDSGTDTITENEIRLKIRDFFGYRIPYAPTWPTSWFEDLSEGQYSYKRLLYDTNLKEEISYNLRNQGWGTPRLEFGSQTLRDPIEVFINQPNMIGTYYPSHADLVTSGLFPDPSDGTDDVVERFKPYVVYKETRNSNRAPNGFFVIDALNRGESRDAVIDELRTHGAQQGVVWDNSLMPAAASNDTDHTLGGPTVVENYAGRVFYAGFTHDVDTTESLSTNSPKTPKLSSYVLFSKLIRTIADYPNCYQEADPTSPTDPDVVATDGGFIKIEEANQILDMKTLQSSLIVFADNGVWSIDGLTDTGFTANEYIVTKISNSGIVGKSSTVNFGDGLAYMATDGIKVLGRVDGRQLSESSISSTTIQSFYNDVGNTALGKPILRTAKGIYDDAQRKVKWLYGADFDPDFDTGGSKELVWDIDLNAFYVYEHGKQSTFDGPSVLKPQVLIPIRTPLSELPDGTKTNVQYLCTRDVTDFYVLGPRQVRDVSLYFGNYIDEDFRDFGSLTYGAEDGLDAAASMATGYIPEGDMTRFKQATLITHMTRTEDGFEDVGGDLVPTNPSSCLAQVAWDWTDSAASNLWGREFQIYKYHRMYFPVDVNDNYDTGHKTVITKTRLRGRGRVLSLMLRTEPFKDCKVLGWSLLWNVNRRP
jgi:hypothetical protein